MIKFYEQNALPEIRDEILSVKANALFETYKNEYSFLSFWIQSDKKECVTALIFSLSGNFTVFAEENADLLELKSFLEVMCQGEILCTEKFGKQLGLKLKQTVFGLKKIFQKKENGHTVEKGFDDFKKLYSILKASESSGISLPDFDEFYADFRMRFNKGFADFLLGDGYCLAANIFENYGLITGISVEKQKRGKGLGKKAIGEFAENSGCSCLLALSEKNTAAFYEKCGFEIVENYGFFEI